MKTIVNDNVKLSEEIIRCIEKQVLMYFHPDEVDLHIRFGKDTDEFFLILDDEEYDLDEEYFWVDIIIKPVDFNEEMHRFIQVEKGILSTVPFDLKYTFVIDLKYKDQLPHYKQRGL